jgi:hypothetical protein
MKHSAPSTDFNDAFVNVTFEDVSINPSGGFLKHSDEPKEKDEVYTNWKACTICFPLYGSSLT